MKIQVTQKDIDRGVPRDALRCPIALALQRELGVDNIAVGRTFTHDAWDVFVQDFDAGRPVRPQKFDLETTPKSRLFGTKKELKKFVRSTEWLHTAGVMR